MTNHYARGTKVEHKAAHHLAVDGYVSIRAAGSKGNSKVDVALWKPGQILFVQAKIGGSLNAAEWNRLVEVSSWVNAIPLLAEYDLTGGCQQTHPSKAKQPRKCGIRFTELTGRYLPRAPMRLQACRPWHSDQLEAAVERAECVCWDGSYDNYEGPVAECDVHGQPSAAYRKGFEEGRVNEAATQKLEASA